jgi:hypothetical protein
MPRVFDCLILERESDLSLIETRFREYADIPGVTHVICEVAPGIFKDSDLAVRTRGRWNHVTVEECELSTSSLVSREKMLRDFMLQGINGSPGDIALLEGTDSLPPREVIQKLAEGKLSCTEVSKMRWRVI